jgi:hypothetical protein
VEGTAEAPEATGLNRAPSRQAIVRRRRFDVMVRSLSF